MKLSSHFLSVLICLPAVVFLHCCNPVDEAEFVERYQRLSDRRIQFRQNMKALGDSTRRQRRFAVGILREALADTSFEKLVDPGYAMWSDSLRKRLIDGQAYFETQYSTKRPLISQWEKNEMKLDRMVQRIKNGDLSESDGLDSMNIMLRVLDSLIIRTDTLLKVSGRRYWDFRKDVEEYRFNARNLRYYYQEKASRKSSP